MLYIVNAMIEHAIQCGINFQEIHMLSVGPG